MTLVELVQKEAKSAKWTGILLIVAGILALLAPLAAGLSIAMLVGVLLVFGGLMYLAIVFKAGSIGRGILAAALGVFSLAAGIYSLVQPAAALAALTLMLAAYFVAAGIIEIIAALGARPAQGWGWLMFGGIISLLLGLMIWRQFPLSGAWAVGILVGVRLLMSGWMLVAIAGATREFASAAGTGIDD